MNIIAYMECKVCGLVFMVGMVGSSRMDPASFQINSAQFLFVFGPTHLLSLFWSLFAGLAQ